MLIHVRDNYSLCFKVGMYRVWLAGHLWSCWFQFNTLGDFALYKPVLLPFEIFNGSWVHKAFGCVSPMISCIIIIGGMFSAQSSVAGSRIQVCITPQICCSIADSQYNTACPAEIGYRGLLFVWHITAPESILSLQGMRQDGRPISVPEASETRGEGFWSFTGYNSTSVSIFVASVQMRHLHPNQWRLRKYFSSGNYNDRGWGITSKIWFNSPRYHSYNIKTHWKVQPSPSGK